MKRVRYWVQPSESPDHFWALASKVNGKMVELSHHRTKRHAIAVGRLVCRSDWKRFGQPTQLTVRNLNGRFAFEHTYGNDPRRSPS